MFVEILGESGWWLGWKGGIQELGESLAEGIVEE